MKILYICEKWPNSTKPTWDWQIDTLVRLGNEIEVLASGSSKNYSPEIFKDNIDKIKVRYFPSTLKNVPKHCILNNRLIYIFIRIKLLIKIFKQNTSFKEKFIQYLRFCCIKSANPDFIFIKNLGTASQFTFLRNVFPEKFIAMYYHGGVIPGVPTTFYKRNSLVFNMCDIIFTNTRYSKNDLIKLGADSNKVYILPVGIKMDKFNLDGNKKYRVNSKLRLISVGRVAEEKGLIYAIKAVEKLVRDGNTAIHYTIVGYGPLSIELMSYIQEKRLESYIKMVGYKNNDIIRNDYYKNSDVIILPSIPTRDWEENQALVLQEAALMYIPAIATNTGGIPEVVKDNVTGFLVPPKDVSQIVKKIKMFINMKEDSLDKMGQEAYKFVTKKFDIDHMTKELIKYSMPGS